MTKTLYFAAAGLMALTLLQHAAGQKPSDPEPASEPYFPDAILAERSELHAFLAGWYSKHLRALDEPSLWRASQQGAAAHSYRFLWLRTFHHPISVRLDIDSQGNGTLTTKVANGAGGYDPGALIENTVRPVTAKEVASFLSRVRNVGYWNLPTVEKTDPNLLGCDGSRWIIEGVNDGRYHIVGRWTPGKGPIHKLGSHLALGLARLEVPKRELY